MERFFIESEVDMKIRQAKKIMKQVYKTRYWAYRQGYYCGKKDAGKLAGDHRLLKAMRLTKKWKSRKIRNEANKMLKKNPLKPRDLQRSALRLKNVYIDAENTRMIRAKLPDGYCDLVRTDVWNGRVNHPEEHDIVKYTAISWYREEFVGGVDLGRNYMHAKYKFFELVVNKKYILEMKHKKNENAR